jgi:hypothetical protein
VGDGPDEPHGADRSGYRASGRVACALAAFAATLIVSGCAEPSDSYSDYQSKVQQTAIAMISAVATGQLASGQLVAGRSTGAFTDAVVTDAEKDAGSIQAALDSRQPPGSRSVALKTQVAQAVQSAVTGLADLRIAVRRDDVNDIQKARAELAKAQKQLERFAS